jgi:uncharacterized Zn finger protein
MRKGKKGAIWSWNYNFGRSYPMPCDKCGALVEMEITASGNPSKLVKCPGCGYVKKKSD